MSSPYLTARREHLVKHQNADGGWGYFPRKQSWLEPTVYAGIVLHGDPATQKVSDRAWALVQGWRNPDGSWRPSASVQTATWGTALVASWAAIRGDKEAVGLALPYLLGTYGTESSFWSRLMSHVQFDANRKGEFKGWPWRPDSASWIEPTVHSVVALKLARAFRPGAELEDRIRLGEGMLLAHGCPDGGWNYGNPRVLKVDLPSYPETTGVALVGLVGVKDAVVDRGLAVARDWTKRTQSPLAQAWLALGLSLHGAGVQNEPNSGDPPPMDDLVVTAVEALGAAGGNGRLLAGKQ